MTLIFGVILLAVTVAMVIVARPSKDGEPRWFVRLWAVGQVYVLSALSSAVIGVGLILSELLS